MEIKCNGTKESIFEKIKTKLKEYKDQGKLQIQDVSFNDPNHEATAKGTGFTANIKCADNLIKINLDLNFLLKPMRGKIEEEIQATVTRLVG